MIHDAIGRTPVPDLQFRYSAKTSSLFFKLWHSHNRQNSSEIILDCPDVVGLEVPQERVVARIVIEGNKSVLNHDPSPDHSAYHSVTLVWILIEAMEFEPVEELGGIDIGRAFSEVAGRLNESRFISAS